MLDCEYCPLEIGKRVDPENRIYSQNNIPNILPEISGKILLACRSKAVIKLYIKSLAFCLTVLAFLDVIMF